MANIINYVLNRSNYVKENEQSGQAILSEKEDEAP